MPRDVLIVVGNEIIEAPMAWRSRFFEYRQDLRKDTRYGKNPMELHGERWRLELPSQVIR